jgi:hypothetical protein
VFASERYDMVFSSYEFVFAFLPVAVLGYFFFDGFLGHRVGPVFLLGASYVFYAWGETRYLMNGGSFIDAIDLALFEGKGLRVRPYVRSWG